MNIRGSALVAHCGAKMVTREDLKEIPIPEGTKTHQPLSHYEIVEVLEEALSFRHVSIVRDEYAVSSDGMKMFGVMDLNNEFSQGRFSIGLRNSNDKSMRLALTAGYRVFVCDNMAFTGDFTPLLHKHTRNLELRDSISIAVDRIHRGFDRLEEQIKGMQGFFLTDNDAKLLIYQAFVEGRRVKPPQAQVPFTLTWARATSEVEFYREISGAPGEDDERLARLLGAMDRFVWRPWRAAIGKKNAAARGEAPADAAAGPEPAGPDELELMRGRRNALRDEVRRRIPPFAKIAWRREGGAVVHWFVPEDERGRFRPLVEEALGGEPYTEQDESGEARPEREELLHA